VKKENTVKRVLNLPVTIAGREITEIYFDLFHIQYGWDKEKKEYNKGMPRVLSGLNRHTLGHNLSQKTVSIPT